MLWITACNSTKCLSPDLCEAIQSFYVTPQHACTTTNVAGRWSLLLLQGVEKLLHTTATNTPQQQARRSMFDFLPFHFYLLELKKVQKMKSSWWRFNIFFIYKWYLKEYSSFKYSFKIWCFLWTLLHLNEMRNICVGTIFFLHKVIYI